MTVAHARRPCAGLAGLDLARSASRRSSEYVRRTASAPDARDVASTLGLLPRLQPVPPRRDPAGHRGARAAAGTAASAQRAGSRQAHRARSPSSAGRQAQRRFIEARRTAWTSSIPTKCSGCASGSTRSWTSTIYPAEPTTRRARGKRARAIRWTARAVIEELKAKARAAGPVEPVPAAIGARRRPHQPRVRAAVRDHGPRAVAPEVFNCSAPDTGNMEMLERYGTPEHKKRWLEPLLAGEIRSAFAMTEPAVRLVRRHQHRAAASSATATTT